MHIPGDNNPFIEGKPESTVARYCHMKQLVLLMSTEHAGCNVMPHYSSPDLLRAPPNHHDSMLPPSPPVP